MLRGEWGMYSEMIRGSLREKGIMGERVRTAKK